jgi:hypothetical membrane protein
MILAAVYLLHIQDTRKLFLVPLALFGIGVLGVGLFPGNTTPHAYFAITTFFSGGVSAILSSKVVNGPYKYIAVALGSIGLFSLFFSSLFVSYIGAGGIERWIAYPITLWMIGYGGYLMGYGKDIK